MTKALKKGLLSLALGATALSGIAATPAFADPDDHHGRDRDHDDHDRGRHEGWDRDRGDHRDDRRGGDWNRDHRGPDRVIVERRGPPPPVIYHYDRYDWNRPDPRWHGGYFPERYYHPGRTIIVTRATRIYRGGDGRYYCRRSDGTTGLIVGAVVGGALGSRLNRGHSDVLGTLLGAGVGAAIGSSIDRGQVVCR